MHVARSGNSSGDEVSAPVITGQGVRRGGIMTEVSWTSDKEKGSVSGLVEPFRTTFVFKINSSGYFNSTGQFIRQTVRRGVVRCSDVRGVVDQRIAYLYSLYFSDQS